MFLETTDRLRKVVVVLILSCLQSACGRGSHEEPTPSGTAVVDTTLVLRQRLAYLERIRSFGGSELQAATQHADPRVRRAAAMALGRIQDAAATAWLLPLVNDSDATVVAQAVWALRQLRDPDEKTRHQLQSILTQQLQLHPLPQTGIYLEALAQHAGPATVSVLGKFMAGGLLASYGSQSVPAHIEGYTALAMAHVGTKQAIDALASMGALTNRDLPAAWQIAEAMSTPPDSALFSSVYSLLQHSHPYARAAGARALGKYKDPRAVDGLLRLLADFEWEVRASSLRALGEIGAAKASSFCASMLSDEHPLVREAALQALLQVEPEGQIHLVRPGLDDPVAAVRLATLRVIARVNAETALDAFMHARSDSLDFVRAEALEVAAPILGVPAAIDTLLSVLEGSSTRDRMHAAVALGDLGDALTAAKRNPVRTALEAALQEDDFVVATLAAEALGKLAFNESLQSLIRTYDERQRLHNDVDVRLAAVQAAAAIAPSLPQSARPLAVDFFEAASADDDGRVAHEARKALATLAGEPEPDFPAPRARPMQPLPDPLPAIDLGLVQVRIVTHHGEILLELDGDRFPRTVASFLQLVDSGFHDNGVFHRVVPGFVIQGGCPRGDGWGDAGFYLPCEYGDLRYDREGIVGMAHAGKDTGGSQFFITHLPVPRLDGRYTAFGRVVAGMEVVDRVVRGDRFSIERAEPAGETATSADPLHPRTRSN